MSTVRSLNLVQSSTGMTATSSHSQVVFPTQRFDCFPLSVIGSLYTSVTEPSAFRSSEHLNAHFCVSRLSFCSSAPPEP